MLLMRHRWSIDAVCGRARGTGSGAGTRNNVIPDDAVLELNIRSYSSVTRQRWLDRWPT